MHQLFAFANDVTPLARDMEAKTAENHLWGKEGWGYLDEKNELGAGTTV